MMMLNLPDYLPKLIIIFFLPFVRVGAMVMALPIIGTHLVPVKFKLILSLALTIVVASNINLSVTKAMDTHIISITLSIFYQAIIGVLLGLIIHIIFQAFVIAGQVISMQMGLGFAQLVDPQNGVSVPAIGQFYMMMATLLYLSMNGHLFIITALIESFNVVHPVVNEYKMIQFDQIVSLGTIMFTYGLKIALPAVVALLITNLAFGVMTKAAPQINIFSIGFSISMILGITVIWITLAFVLPHFNDLTENVHIALYNIVES